MLSTVQNPRRRENQKKVVVEPTKSRAYRSNNVPTRDLAARNAANNGEA